jgi:hypothetical protein
MTTATPYVRDFGLMADCLKDLGIEGVANKSIFREKQSALHAALMERDAARAKKEGAGKEDPEMVIEGSENA